MRRSLRKVALLAVAGALAFMAWTDVRPQPVYASQFCMPNGRVCFNEGQQFLCTYLGCCGYIGEGFCTCQDGHWNCPIPPECPPDYCR